MAEGKRINRVMTQKYDMQSLRALQVLEAEFLKDLCSIYSCEEEDIPAEVDLMEIFNLDQKERQGAMEECLKDAPDEKKNEIASAIQVLLVKIQEVAIAKDLQSK